MKYTVVIRQPVPDNVRTNLETQLVERFGLNAEQATRLAARRAGRLMKPTSQARAELLLRVYQSVGAQVVLEEVQEEGGSAQPFQMAQSDDAVLAPPLRNNATMMDFIPNARPAENLPSMPSALRDAFASPAASAALFTPTDGPAPADQGGSGAFAAEFAGKDGGAELLPDWARKDPNVPPDRNPAVNLLDSLSPAPGLAGAAASPTLTKAAETKGADDWADFAGGLSLPEAAPAEAAPRQGTEFLTAVTEEPQNMAGPRNSLTQQIRLGTLLPLGLAGLLTLGLLGVTLPRLQGNLMKNNVDTVADTLGTTLATKDRAVTTTQLDAILRDPNIGFVRLELPGGNTITRTSKTDPAALNKQLAEWVKTNPTGGNINVAGNNYYVSRTAFVSGGNGQIVPAEADTASQNVLHRVTVGLSSDQANTNLRNTLLLTLFSILVGSLLASLLAARAANRIVQPLSELVKVADAISLGDLTRPVKVSRNDEIGDLAQALERMRLSLEAAMDRLRRRKRS